MGCETLKLGVVGVDGIGTWGTDSTKARFTHSLSRMRSSEGAPISTIFSIWCTCVREVEVQKADICVREREGGRGRRQEHARRTRFVCVRGGFVF